jgi:hypothetical protein
MKFFFGRNLEGCVMAGCMFFISRAKHLSGNQERKDLVDSSFQG